MTPEKWGLRCRVVCLSHKLSVEALAPFLQDALLIRASNVSERAFDLTCYYPFDCRQTPRGLFVAASEPLSIFLFSMNAATLGFFVWDPTPSLGPTFRAVAYPDSRELVSSSRATQWISDQLLTSSDVRFAQLLFSVMAKDTDRSARDEYIKGLLHLRLSFFPYDFHREAFSNFYRAFEYVVTARLLRRRRLANEIRDMTDALSNLGIPGEVVAEFPALYALRGEQIMHAQKRPGPIDRDSVLKMKVFLDAVLHALYRPLVDGLIARAGNDSSENDAT